MRGEVLQQRYHRRSFTPMQADTRRRLDWNESGGCNRTNFAAQVKPFSVYCIGQNNSIAFAG